MTNVNPQGPFRVLLVENDVSVREALRSLLQGEGASVEVVDGHATAVERAAQRAFDVIVLNQNLPGARGEDGIASLRTGDQPAEVVLLAGYGTVADTALAMRLGAADIVDKPVHHGRFLGVVRRCIASRQVERALAWSHERVRDLSSDEILGVSPGIRGLVTRVDAVADAVDATVLVSGPAGSGKELVARCIHSSSDRRDGPFVTLNCAVASESAFEAELFGYEAGVFAGSSREGKSGALARAAGGTLFLDEIGALSRPLQTKVLRLLQDRTYRRVGGSQDWPVDLRIVTSSSRDLRRAVGDGSFREDLFLRLHVMNVEVPALEDRAEDIPLLAHFFLDQFARQMGKSLTGFTSEATETLCEYHWPGNVRELRNAIERAAIACRSGMVDECHLPRFEGGTLDQSDVIPRNVFVLDGNDCSIRALEGQLVGKVLEATQWNISRAAALLGINRTTLYNKIRLYDLGERPRRDSAQAS
jgi:DNA-binding NtrC family response regulator